MHQLSYDLKICSTIKALRQLRQIKQSTLAEVLQVDQSTYCRIERGETTITPAQLKIIAEALQTSLFQILTIADADESKNFKLKSLSNLLIKFVVLFEEANEKLNFSEEELHFIVSKIRLNYADFSKRKTKTV